MTPDDTERHRTKQEKGSKTGNQRKTEETGEKGPNGMPSEAPTATQLLSEQNAERGKRERVT